MKTFKEIHEAYLAKFNFSRNELKALQEGTYLLRHLGTGTGYFPYIITGVVKELEYQREEGKRYFDAYEAIATCGDGEERVLLLVEPE